VLRPQLFPVCHMGQHTALALFSRPRHTVAHYQCLLRHVPAAVLRVPAAVAAAVAIAKLLLAVAMLLSLIALAVATH
jgi:hypothetical protein